MNKYFLPVYHSQLKPWIKWWILKRLNGGQSSLKAVTISSGTLTKVDKSKALSIKEYYGNTVQNGTPTPSSPIEVKTVSGDNEVTVTGSNFLDIEKIKTQTWKIEVYKGTRLNDISPKGTWYIKAKLKEGKTAISGLYVSIAPTINPNASTNAFAIRDGDPKNWGNYNTFTGTDLYISFYPTHYTIEQITEVYDLWISKSDTTYEPFTGNSYRVDFGGIELCKIGDFKDKIINDNGTWKVEKNIGKVVLNGSENWASSPYGTNSWSLANYIITYFHASKIILMTRKFKGIAYDERSSSISSIYASNLATFYIRNTPYTTKEEVQQAMNGEDIYYILATPTTTEITNENLITQLNALYEFYINSSTVTISNNSEIPFEVLLEYYGR